MQAIVIDNVELALKRLFNAAIATAFPQIPSGTEALVSVSKKFGDYQCPSSMGLTKTLSQISPDLKLNAEAVAKQLVASVPANDMIEKCDVTAQGFINIFINKDWTCGAVKRILERGITPPETPKEKILVDFSSPNIAKELHVGHLRSTIIGDCLARVFEFIGQDVARINHVGDWGTQFGMLILYMKQKFPNFLEEPPVISDLVAFYKESKKEFDSNPEFKDKARLEVVKLQSYDEESIKAWKMICDMSRKEFQEIYDRLDIKLEERGESFYNKMLPDVIQKLEDANLVEVNDGAKVIISTKNVPADKITAADMARLMMYFVQTKKGGAIEWEPAFLKVLKDKGVISKKADDDTEYIQLSKKDSKKFSEYDPSVDNDKLAVNIEFAHKPVLHHELVAALTQRGVVVTKEGKEEGKVQVPEIQVPLFPIPLMVRKSDGGFSYDSTDLAAIYHRFIVEKFDRVVYVTDVGQFDHFKMVATAAESAGWIRDGARWQHAGFGLVTGEGGKKLATRSGETIKLKDLLDEGRDRAYNILVEREKSDQKQGFTEDEMKSLSRKIGYGAIKYFDLRQNRVSNYAFTFDKVLDLNGNTAVYLLYSYARISSIKRKADVEDVIKTILPATEKIEFETEQEKNLALAALRLGPVVLKTAEEVAPKNLTDFAYELVQNFNDFYNKCRVIGHEKQSSRLLLVEMVGITLKTVLTLLGIDVADRL